MSSPCRSMMKRMTLSEKRTISVPCSSSSAGSSSGGTSGYSYTSSGYSSGRKVNSGRMERPEAVSFTNDGLVLV